MNEDSCGKGNWSCACCDRKFQDRDSLLSHWTSEHLHSEISLSINCDPEQEKKEEQEQNGLVESMMTKYGPEFSHKLGQKLISAALTDCFNSTHPPGENGQNQQGPPPPSALTEALKKFSLIEKANCATCAYQSEDSDGEHGEIFCGTICSKRSGDDYETYLEDQGVDLSAEKGCWEPNFWMAKTSDEIRNFEDEKKAVEAFVAECEKIIKNFQPDGTQEK